MEENELIFQRKAYEKMLIRKRDFASNYVLFLKGARRVGKTTLAEEFGKKEYKSYILVKFNEADQEVKDLFVNGLMDLDSFYENLSFKYNKKLYLNESLIILDEIQLFPLARQALKALLEDGRYHFIETGSTAGIIKKSKESQILAPSEEYVLDINPLDFDEFLLANGKENLVQFINKYIDTLTPIPNMIFKEIFNLFRIYMVLGGMPKVVMTYLQTSSFSKADFVKRTILETYRGDMKNQEAVSPTQLFNIFDSIPSELSKHDKEFVLSHADKNARFARYSESIGWLEDSKVANVSRCVTEPSTALSLSLEDNRFKMYLVDTGLLVTLAFDDGNLLSDDFYESLIKDRLHINEGMIIENVIAQGITSLNKKLRYNVKSDPDKKIITREIDFLIKYKLKITPIEVKSSENNFKTKSLDDFIKTYSSICNNGIVFYPGNVKKINGIYYLPYFYSYYLDKINFR